MNLDLRYRDQAVFFSVTSNGYQNSKTVMERAGVPVIFLQDTGFGRSGFQDSINSDATCYPDITNSFVLENADRLEGMYILMQLYGSTVAQSWYKVTKCIVNRDHLLNNTIDNIQLFLKKTAPLPQVS